MGVSRPSGEHVDQMLDPGGWPELDEDNLHNRANEFRGVLQQVTQALEGWQHEQAEIFHGGVWSGGAANSANAKVSAIIGELSGLQNDLVNVITWYNSAYGLVEQTKSKIADVVDQAQQQIKSLLNDSSLDDDERTNAIDNLIKTIHEANVNNVGKAAGQLPAFNTWKAPADAREKLLNQKAPPSTDQPIQSNTPGGQQPPTTAAASPNVPGARGGQNPPAGALPGVQSGQTAPGGAKPGTSNAVAASPAGQGALSQSVPPGAQPGTVTPGPVSPPLQGVRSGGQAGPAIAQQATPNPQPPPPPPAQGVRTGGQGGPASAQPATPSSGPGPSLPPPVDALRPPGQISSAPTAPPPSATMGAAPIGGGGGGGNSLGSMWSGAFQGDHGGLDRSDMSRDMSRSDISRDMQMGQAGRPDAGQHPAAGLGQGLGQVPVSGAALGAAAQVPLAAAESAMTAPAAAHGPAATSETSATQVSSSSHSGSGGSGGGGGQGGGGGGGGTRFGGGMGGPMMSGSGGTGSSMPLLPPATPPPAAPVQPSGSGAPGTPGTGQGGPSGPGVHPASTTSTGGGGVGGSVTSSQADAAPAPIPVSTARAQKDAIADATNRQSATDQVRVAYRVAAALNAADMTNPADFRFFWMTAVTADGRIVVANSYGLAYVPEAVTLPTQVIMASADDTVPAEQRARWATYPNLALQDWAAHHDTTLRVVIARQEHFEGIDPGAPKHLVADEDIPVSGKMQGRSRLEVVAPSAAAQLAGISDLSLVDLLPPAPVDASSPADQRNTLWWEVMKHLMSSDAERGEAHLQAFVAYANHCQELALYAAHTAVHAVEQRGAVADWLYWQHITGLLSSALAGTGHR